MADIAAPGRQADMEILLIRHGQPELDRPGPGSAGADPVLTAEGRSQAALLGRWLAAGVVRAPDAIYSSTMRRAHQTALALADCLPVPLHLDGRLREFDSGAASYVPAEQASEQDRRSAWLALATGQYGAHVFDPDTFEAAVCAALDDIVAAHPDGTVAVVCHGGVINSWLGVVLGRPRGMFFLPDYTSVSRVRASRSGQRRLLSLNETTHLQLAARLPQDAREQPGRPQGQQRNGQPRSDQAQRGSR